MAGYDPRKSTWLHATLSSRCIIIADDCSIIALISMDLLGISVNEINELKDEIKQATGINKKLDKNYFSNLCTNTKDATVQALNSIENVQAIVRSGQSDVKTVNRRNPERSVYNEFTIIEFHNNENQNVVSMLHFSCHPVVLGPFNHALTADYVHYVRKAVESEIGGTAVFFNGSFGNINPPQLISGKPYDRSKGTFKMAQDFGEELANDMLHNYSKTDTASITINAITRKVSTFYRYTYISILDLGIIQIAMLPGEPLDSFGNEVKECLPGPYKITMGLTNDYLGYLVPEDEWGNCTNSFKSECYEETVGGGKKVYPLLTQAFSELADELY